MFFCRAFRLILVFIYCLLVARLANAQVPSILSPAASAPAQASPPPDPLKRETPKGSLLGFIKAAGEERYNVAIRYFQPSTARHRPSTADEENLASQLFTILSLKFSGPLDSLSNDPLGHLDDGLPADQEQIGGVRGLSEDFPILLVRVEEEHPSDAYHKSFHGHASLAVACPSALRSGRPVPRAPPYLFRPDPRAIPRQATRVNSRPPPAVSPAGPDHALSGHFYPLPVRQLHRHVDSLSLVLPKNYSHPGRGCFLLDCGYRYARDFTARGSEPWPSRLVRRALHRFAGAPLCGSRRFPFRESHGPENPGRRCQHGTRGCRHRRPGPRSRRTKDI